MIEQVPNLNPLLPYNQQAGPCRIDSNSTRLANSRRSDAERYDFSLSFLIL